MPIKGNELVEKRNILNEIRRNNMSLQEHRFFAIYLSKINARDINTRRVIFPINDFKKIMELGRMNIQHLQVVTNSLLSKVVNIKNPDGGYTAFQLFKECEVFKDEFGEWYIAIDAHDKALPLMFEFKEEYFTYELWNALRLKSPNQLRMYELLKQYERAGSRKIALKDLREYLGIKADEYPRWDRFKDRVLNACQQALAESTDIKFEYTPIKVSGKTTGVEFRISKNKDYVDQLTLDEFLAEQGRKGEYELDEAEYTVYDDDESQEAAKREAREQRDEICFGLREEIFDEFNNNQLRELVKFALEKVSESRIEKIDRDARYLSRKEAMELNASRYIEEKILYVNARGAKKSRYAYVLAAVKNNYQ